MAEPHGDIHPGRDGNDEGDHHHRHPDPIPTIHPSAHHTPPSFCLGVSLTCGQPDIGPHHIPGGGNYGVAQPTRCPTSACTPVDCCGRNGAITVGASIRAGRLHQLPDQALVETDTSAATGGQGRCSDSFTFQGAGGNRQTQRQIIPRSAFVRRASASAPSQKSGGYPASEKPAGRGRSLHPYRLYMGAGEDKAPEGDARAITFQIRPSFAAAGCHQDFWGGALGSAHQTDPFALCRESLVGGRSSATGHHGVRAAVLEGGAAHDEGPDHRDAVSVRARSGSVLAEEDGARGPYKRCGCEHDEKRSVASGDSSLEALRLGRHSVTFPRVGPLNRATLYPLCFRPQAALRPLARRCVP